MLIADLRTVDGQLGLRQSAYPRIASAVLLAAPKLGFDGQVIITKLRARRSGQAVAGGSKIEFDESLEQRPPERVLEAVVHEIIHNLGMHHADYFRSRGGPRCDQGSDTLSHCVAAIVGGRETWAGMVWRHENIVGIGGARPYPKKLLRLVASVEALALRRYHVANALGGCAGIAEITDARMYRWQQMTPRERALQQAKMQVGRLERNGYTFYDREGTIWQEAANLESKYRMDDMVARQRGEAGRR